MVSVLIVGALPYDSGKTPFALNLIREAIEEGFDVGVSKPVGGFNGWYQYEFLKKSIEFGLLIGEDAYKLHNAAKSIDRIELESPVTVLLLPPDPERVGWRVSSYMGISFQNQVVIVRISGLHRTIHYYIPENLNKLTKPLRGEVGKLISVLNPKPLSVGKLDDILSESRKIADEVLRYLEHYHDLMVIESYANYAAPTFGSLDVDVVVVVAPSKAVIFDGEQYKRAVSLYFNLKSPWIVTTEDVLPLLRPRKIVEFGPEGPKNSLEKVLQVVDASSSL